MSSLSENTKSENAPWWTPIELNTAREALANHGTAYSLGGRSLPDSVIATQVLGNFTNFVEFTTWLEDLVERRPAEGIRTWGLYEHDARCNWPQRRAEVEAEVAAKLEAKARERDRQRLEAERQRLESEAANRERQAKCNERERVAAECAAKGWKRIRENYCDRCAGYGRDPNDNEICGCEAGRKLARDLSRCPKCEFSGFIQRSDGSRMLDWCDCEYGQWHRVAEPRFVSQHNSHIEGLRARRSHAQAGDSTFGRLQRLASGTA
jgi:hypothetical protein